MWKMEMMWLPALAVVSVLAPEEGEGVGLVIHIYGATVTFPSPASDPATKCIGRSEGSMEWCGRDSL